MKDKWKGFFALIEISKVESSADGIFMKEEDIDKIIAIHAGNETEIADLQTAKDALTTSATAKDATIATLTSEKTTLTNSNTTLTEENARLSTELAAAQAGETVVPVKKDPAPSGDAKVVKGKNERNADRNAAVLRGEEPEGEDEEEETEAPESKKK